MLIISIESSCDETSIAFLEGEKIQNDNFYQQLNSFKELSSIVSSQIDIHAQYGGVIPEIGARAHADQIHLLFLQTLKQAQGLDFGDFVTDDDLDFLSKLDYIFVTTNPGLKSALKVGYEFAKTLQSLIYTKTGKLIKLKKINHLKGHIASSFYQQDNLPIKNIDIFPHLHLLVSGGNTQLILINSPEEFQILGKTLDDAAGESFDKIGRMLGFPYPGGVYLAKTAGLNNQNILNFPIGMQNPQLNFSYSGLKTSIRYFLERENNIGFEYEAKLSDTEVKCLLDGTADDKKLLYISNTAISAQFSIVKQLINKTKKAISLHNIKSIGLSGGVSANKLLRQEVSKLSIKQVFMAPLKLTGDNAVMIALAGIWKHIYSK